jgi:prolyl oligopeptidase
MHVSRFIGSYLASPALLVLCAAALVVPAQGRGGTVKDSSGQTIVYPDTKKIAVVDTVHGKRITDPYRWLEKTDDPEVQAWLGAQSALTRRVLDAIPCRAAIRSRLAALSTIGSVDPPRVKGTRYFIEKRTGGENQPVIYWREGALGEANVLIDPNNLSAEGTIAVDWWYPSQDGRVVAYGLSEGGSEQSTLHLIEVDSGELLADTIPRTRGCTVAWLPDGTGFYYSRFPNRGEVPAGEENFHSRIRFHKIGTEAAADPVIFGEGRDMRDWLSCSLSEDGGFLIVHAAEGAKVTELYVRDLRDSSGTFVCISGGREAHFYGAAEDGEIYIQTDDGAPNYRIFKTDAAHLARESWKEIVPERSSRLEFMELVGHRLFVCYLENASNRLYEYGLEGGTATPIGLPGIGTVYGVGGAWKGSDCFIGFVSFFTPQTVYRYDLGEELMSTYDKVDSPIDVSPYTSEQVWYRSKDGTKIPMFIVRRKDLALDGRNPTILYGYGGFDISITPSFLKNAMPWLERGGVYALACLRGGGEFGEKWHEAGMLANKQNVFDDYIAAAEWLSAKKYTSPARLALFGGSNGGLLVGAAITQRPDVCKAAICAVPLLDMLRYQRFSVGRYWITEYGDPDNPKQFEFLYNYSPYHHVKPGGGYPATLFTTAESDSRVDPMHAMKMTALLQARSGSDNPILLRFETNAGHGIGAPAQKVVDEYADFLAFLCWQLGVEMK